ncbi:hypothetical protein J31TS3_23340 [Paenibacillus lactis]|nr:hypothetical protein J31TS3_23340 [Paenibacillus lactis]
MKRCLAIAGCQAPIIFRFIKNVFDQIPIFIRILVYVDTSAFRRTHSRLSIDKEIVHWNPRLARVILMTKERLIGVKIHG